MQDFLLLSLLLLRVLCDEVLVLLSPVVGLVFLRVPWVAGACTER